MENNSQELQALEAQLLQEVAPQVIEEPTVAPEGTNEGKTDTNESANSQPDDELSKLKEQRQRMLATKSKDEKEKSLLRQQLEEAQRIADEAQEKINSFKGLSDDERTVDHDEDYIDAVLTKKVAQSDMNRIQKEEKLDFIKSNSDLSVEEFAQIETLKKDFPNLTWERAKTIYLAENNPTALISKPKQTALPIGNNNQALNEKAKTAKDMSDKELEDMLSKMDITF